MNRCCRRQILEVAAVGRKLDPSLDLTAAYQLLQSELPSAPVVRSSEVRPPELPRCGPVEAGLGLAARRVYWDLPAELRTTIDGLLSAHTGDRARMTRASAILEAGIFKPGALIYSRLDSPTIAAIFERMLFPDRDVASPALTNLHDVAQAALTMFQFREAVRAKERNPDDLRSLQFIELDHVLSSALARLGETLAPESFGRKDFIDLTTLDGAVRAMATKRSLMRSEGGMLESQLSAAVWRAIKGGLDPQQWAKEIQRGLSRAETDEDFWALRNAALDYLGAERRYELVPESTRKKTVAALTAARTAFEKATENSVVAPAPIFTGLKDAYEAWRTAKPESAMEALVDNIEQLRSGPIESALARAAAHAEEGRYGLAAMVAKRAYAEPLDRLAYAEQPDVLQYEILAHLQSGDLEKASKAAGYLYRFSIEQDEASDDRVGRFMAFQTFLQCLRAASHPQATLASCEEFAQGSNWRTPHHATVTQAFTEALRAGRRPELAMDLLDHTATNILKKHFAEALAGAPIRLTPLRAEAQQSSPKAVEAIGAKLIPRELQNAIEALRVLDRSVANGPKPTPTKVQQSQHFARERAVRLMDAFREKMLQASTLSAEEARGIALYVPLTDTIHASYGAEMVQEHLAGALRWTNGVGCRSLHTVDSEGHGSFANQVTGQLNITSSAGEEDKLRADIFHEFGHHREFENEATKKLMFDWRAEHATSTDTVSANGYIVFPGPFVRSYVGRDYGPIGTEVLSVGLEHFRSAESMVDLAVGHQSHLHLMLGVLRGYLA